MTKVPTWKLVLLLIYACLVISILMFTLSLVVQWLGGGNEFFEPSQLYVALKMGFVGFVLGVVLWLAYYIPYRRGFRRGE